MSTKKKVSKKVVALKPEKVVKEKKVKVVKSSVELVSFSIKATIPVMVFGNIQPEVVVKAKTIEEAQAYALPIIEKLFEQYVEAPRDGSPKPGFLSKANVTVTEKVVPQAEKPVQKEELPLKVEKKGETKEEFEKSLEETPPVYATSQAYAKGVKAIEAAMSLDALDMIEQQIKDSVKLTPEEKPMLFTVLLKKKKEFKS